MVKVVREPIQVYLTPDERAELDRAAGALGVSRSEVLRRGISAVSTLPAYDGPLRRLWEKGLVSLPTLQTAEPPPARPVAKLTELLAELDSDRSDR